MHEIWYQFADAKIDWFTWWCLSRFTRYCTLNSLYCKKRHIFSVFKSTWLAFKICWRRVTRNFLIDNFDLVLLNKLTYALYPPVLCTHQCGKTFMTQTFYRLANNFIVSCVLFLQKQPPQVFCKRRRS